MDRESLLNSHQHKLHHLAQYLAAFGSSYLPEKDDHSHQSLVWDIASSALRSQSVNNISICLEYPDLMLYIIKDERKFAFDPLGATGGAVESWIRESLSAMGLPPGTYNLNMGFTPTSPEDRFISLDNDDEKILLQLTEERNIAQKALEAVKTTSEMETSTILVWPHHFDTAMKLYPKPDDPAKGFGLGYAPADQLSDTPYFYAYCWSDNPIDYTNTPTFAKGHWILEDWEGAVIPVDQALDLRVITRFYSEFISVMRMRL